MKTSLKYVTTIQTGVFEKPVQQGEIVYLQAKHFDENGEISGTLYPDLNSNNKINKHILKTGDVLFAAKGTRNFAALYENDEPPAVASTSFFVIRLHDNTNILPGYLVWFLNLPIIQTLLKGHARGTSMASISKAVLSDLQIPVPDLKRQELVLKIFKLRNEEKKLKQQIENLKEKEIQNLLINAIK